MAYSAGAVLTAAQLNASLSGYTTVNGQTGTTYTFVSTDAGGLVTATNASSQTYTIPTNATWAAATGTWIEVVNVGTGSLTLAGAGGVTLNGATAVPVNGRARIVKTGTNTWYGTVAATAPGRVLIGTYSPSASSSFSIDNCFSSTYDIHIIETQLTLASGSAIVAARMRVSATDNSAASYDVSNIIDNPTTPASSLTTGATSINILRATTTLSTATITVAKAATATATSLRSVYVAGITSPIQGTFAGGHNVATAYDGITFIPASSTISGTIRVYGLAQ